MECFQVVADNQKEEDMKDRESSMLNNDMMSISKDEVIIVNNHKHPLFKISDPNALCDRVKTGRCISLDSKSSTSAPIYFKCIKPTCEFIMCALCTTPNAKYSKKLKHGKTCMIF